MQYPLEGLQVLICDILHPDKLQELYLQDSNRDSFTKDIITTAGQARINICRYIPTAKNEQQAGFMLHAMDVVLHEMQHTVARYENLLSLSIQDTCLLQPLLELYALMREQLESVLLFLHDNFYFAKNPELPSWLLKEKNNSAHKEQHLFTNLSVSQLALFLRLLVDTGIIAGNSNIAMLATKTATIIQTKKTAHISAESLRIKFYAPEKAAVNILKEYVAQMMNLLRNY